MTWNVSISGRKLQAQGCVIGKWKPARGSLSEVYIPWFGRHVLPWCYDYNMTMRRWSSCVHVQCFGYLYVITDYIIVRAGEKLGGNGNNCRSIDNGMMRIVVFTVVFFFNSIFPSIYADNALSLIVTEKLDRLHERSGIRSYVVHVNNLISARTKTIRLYIIFIINTPVNTYLGNSIHTSDG